MITAMPTTTEVLARDAVQAARVDLTPGFTVRAATATVMKCGEAVLRADSPAELESRCDELCTWFETATTVVPTGTSPSQLRALNGGEWIVV